MFVFESQIILQDKQTNASLSEKEARVFCLRYFTFKTFYIILKILYTSIFKLHPIRRKDPTLIVRIFLFQRAHIQYRDIFIFKHFAFTSEMFSGFYGMDYTM